MGDDDWIVLVARFDFLELEDDDTVGDLECCRSDEDVVNASVVGSDCDNRRRNMDMDDRRFIWRLKEPPLLSNPDDDTVNVDEKFVCILRFIFEIVWIRVMIVNWNLLYFVLNVCSSYDGWY